MTIRAVKLSQQVFNVTAFLTLEPKILIKIEQSHISWYTRLLVYPLFIVTNWATYLCVNLIFHSHMKHIVTNFHFVQEKVKNGDILVYPVYSADQLADAFTKLLSRQWLSTLWVKIAVLPRDTILRGILKNLYSQLLRDCIFSIFYCKYSILG